MKKQVLFLLTAALAPVIAFAVDGVVLINQSTVMAAGGFPYTISQPGSYKLSGNLQVPNPVSGIQIATSNVTLDLNGFSIVSTGPVSPLFVQILIGAVGSIKGVTVRNGIISPNGGLPFNFAGTQGATVVEDLTILTPPTGGSLYDVGSSIVRRLTDPNGGVVVTCPAVVVDSLARFFRTNGTGCTFTSVSGPVQPQ